MLLTKGKASLKKFIASKVDFDASTLPYNKDFVTWLGKQHALGRRLVLCTATDESIALKIASHLSFFDEVVASNGVVNLEGRYKAAALIEKYGEGRFDYAGNSKSDLQVWKHARFAVVVNGSPSLIEGARDVTEVEEIFQGYNSKISTWSKALRIHQWLKNVLLFAPMLAAHQLSDGSSWISLIWGFFAFSLCASAVYIANDLMDLESDRRHPRKCNRPFACGKLPIYKGVIAVPTLFVISCGIGAYVGITFLSWLLVYFLLTCIYSIKLKQLALIDCMALAILYTFRILAGAAAVDIPMSFWLLAFSVFLFLSLAFIKRFSELQVHILQGNIKVHGRGYFTDDAPLIKIFGIASGFLSVLILALYLNSPEVQLLYSQPEWIWGNVPVMLFWVSYLWLRAHRDEMHDDPLIFAVKDKVSLTAGILFAMFILLGSL